MRCAVASYAGWSAHERPLGCETGTRRHAQDEGEPMNAVAHGSDRPITILICALGGEGGGVLSEWLVEAALQAGYPVQSTSIPGVAQRTGATTYYVEIFPVRARLGARRRCSAFPGRALDVLSHRSCSSRCTDRQRAPHLAPRSSLRRRAPDGQRADALCDGPGERADAEVRRTQPRAPLVDMCAVRSSRTVVSAVIRAARASAPAVLSARVRGRDPRRR